MVTDRCSTLGLLGVLSGDYADKDAALGFPAFRLVRGEIFYSAMFVANCFAWISNSDHIIAAVPRSRNIGHQFALVPDVLDMCTGTTP